MEIGVRSEGSVTVIAIKGSLDGNTSAQALETILPLAVANCRLLFDMKECNYISSAGLRLLLMIAKELKRNEGRGVFAALAEETKDVMKMTGFDTILEDYETLSQAMETLEEGDND